MKKDVTQRVNKFLRISNFSIQMLAEGINMNRNTLAGKLNGSRGLDIETIEAILKQFPLLSAEWLLRGTEPMERTEPTPDPELKAVCIDQAKEIYRLKQRISELEGGKKQLA